MNICSNLLRIPTYKCFGISPIPILRPWESIDERVIIDYPIPTTIGNASDAVFKEYISQDFPNYIQIYTDGSKLTNGDTSAAVYLPQKNMVSTYKLNPQHSVMGAELFAILKALELVHTLSPRSPVLTLSDSMSALNVIRNTSTVTYKSCLLYTSPSPRDKRQSRMPSSA